MSTSRQQGRLFHTGKGRMCRRQLEIYERAAKWSSQTKRKCTKREELLVGISKAVNGIKQQQQRIAVCHPKEDAGGNHHERHAH
eukprot:3799011-Pleurochrysis_carterae.AAC.2